MNLARQVGLVCALSGIMTAGAVASGFQLNEHGARAMAQGGAWAARASDGSAIFFNPAGLGFQRGTNITAGTTLITLSSGFTPVAGTETKQKSQTFFPSNAYVSHTMENGLAFGLGNRELAGEIIERIRNENAREELDKVVWDRLEANPHLKDTD